MACHFCVQDTSVPVSPKTLNTIQAAGTAAFKADAQLKAVVKDYGSQVQAAMLSSPFDLTKDSLFEEWKSVCRLSQAVGQIEAELQKIHAAAIRLQGDVLPSNKPCAIAPVANQPSTVDVITQGDAVDLTVKKPRKLKVKTKTKTKMARQAKSDGSLPANATSLLAHLSSILNPDTFEQINQTSVATAINTAKGSVGASVRRLVDEGFLAQDPALGYRLTEPKTSFQSVSNSGSVLRLGSV
jgi:hypothetical protein